jgi:hypothetical protein
MCGTLHPTATLKLVNLDFDHLTGSDEGPFDVIRAACLNYTAKELRQLYMVAGLVGDILPKPDEFDKSGTFHCHKVMWHVNNLLQG